jgi:hypothetical protein
VFLLLKVKTLVLGKSNSGGNLYPINTKQQFATKYTVKKLMSIKAVFVSYWRHFLK